MTRRTPRPSPWIPGPAGAAARPIPYLWNASAHVVPVREVDMTTERVMLDDADGADHPAEGVVDDGQRAEIMARILDFFDVDPETAPDGGVGLDAGDAGDAGDATPTCRDGPCDEGCGCASAGTGEGVGGGLLGLWLLLWGFGARRRRAR